MIDEIYFDRNYLNEMAKQKKDVFWTKSLLTVLLSSIDLKAFSLPEEISFFYVFSVQGPPAHKEYGIVVAGGLFEGEETRLCTGKIVLQVNVDFRVKNACKRMLKKNSNISYYQETDLQLHEVQIGALVNGMRIIPPPDYLQRIPFSEHKFWNPEFLRTVLNKILDKFNSDKVNGFFSSHFPAETNQLGLINIIAKGRERSPKVSYKAFILEVIPIKSTVDELGEEEIEKLELEPIHIVINIPKDKYQKSLELSDHNCKDYGAYSILPEITISEIYNTKRYQPTALIPKLAKSMMSGLREEVNEENLDSYYSYTPIDDENRTFYMK